MGKHIMTATNITTNPMNHSVAEYACVDIPCVGSTTMNSTENERNRRIYERLQIQSQEQQNQKYTKQTSKTSTTTSSNSTSMKNKITQQHHPTRQPPSYNLGNYFPRVSSEPTSRKNYQTSASRERDLKVKTIQNDSIYNFDYFLFHASFTSLINVLLSDTAFILTIESMLQASIVDLSRKRF